jgi:HAD superfamily hydrolase (TIGR01509 family)
VSRAAPPAPAAILFDLDGTLVDTVRVRIAAWLEAFAEHGISVSPQLVGPYMGADGRWVATEVARQVGVKLDASQADEIDRVAGQRFDRLNTAPRPCPGAVELLASLDAAGMPWAIATSSRPGQATRSIEALGLPGPPTFIDSRHVLHAKPEPDLLLESARQLGVAPGSCWYVGDSRWDMLAARASGMTAIGVASGVLDERSLARAGAHRTFDSLVDLRANLVWRGSSLTLHVEPVA